MKYKIQNNFTHNDAQVLLARKCISVHIQNVKLEQKRTTYKNETKREKKTNHEVFITTTGIAVVGKSVCRFLETYVGCRQENDFNVCNFFLFFLHYLLFNHMLSSACTSILYACMSKQNGSQ